MYTLSSIDSQEKQDKGSAIQGSVVELYFRQHKSYVWYPVTQCQFTASTLTTFCAAHTNTSLSVYFHRTQEYSDMQL